MPTTISEAPIRSASSEPPRKKWTRAECAAFEATGLWEGQKLELIEGELIDKMPKKRPHTYTLTFFRGWLVRVFGNNFVDTETSIDAAPEDNPTSEPVPDAIVLNRSTGKFDCNPRPEDLLLVVEISDTSLGFDLGPKAALYAGARIQDYWVLDIAGRRLIVHRQPSGGRYLSVTAYREDESVAPLAAPDSAFTVATAFRP